MKKYWISLWIIISFQLFCFGLHGQNNTEDLIKTFRNPPDEAKPWVFWYWMEGAVSRDGISADLEAMKEVGIGGAYLVPIRGAANPPVYNPPINQLTPEWFEMVGFAMKEANRLNLKIAMHSSDGFATAGGPWITPELSMQKVVWSDLQISGGKQFSGLLPKPESFNEYYNDIAILAFPATNDAEYSTRTIIPKITTNIPDVNPQFLVNEQNKETFRSDSACWIQYAFEKPFTCRSIITRSGVNNIQPHRLKIEVSDDGKLFVSVCQLEPPRHGWMDTDEKVTHSITPVTGRFFRFIYDKKGSEPGAEDLEAAKWKPNLKLKGLELSSKPVINQYEGKSGLVWRISKYTTGGLVPDSLCIPKDKIIDITKYSDKNGLLTWAAPEGNWNIIRIGHTSTGHLNNTAGTGKGLECDKLNPDAVKLQFDKWFAEIIRKIGPEMSNNILKIFHVDSWECGSQNWSPVFRNEFKKRRGYDLSPYLPVMAGIPVQSADVSERFLYDVRQTIMELVNENFYETLANLSKENGMTFTGESTAPVMVGDGMAHYKIMDVPMGEFWVKSPTHDKLNDMLDATSGGHIYGKNIIQAEAFTTLRMDWNEHPAMLKTIGDRNFALGANRFVFHVTALNPWLNKKPGMTLGPIGLYFQRDQTWWKPGRAWIEYLQRCQALLQKGKPVTDIAVFIGEEIPRRSLTPEKLITTFPGMISKEKADKEERRLKNIGEPVIEKPGGVWAAANIANPADWVNPLNGYAYDSFNPEVLSMAKVDNGNIVLPGGAKYRLLSLPGDLLMIPDKNSMTHETSQHLLNLVKEGATIIVNKKPLQSPTLSDYPLQDSILQNTINLFWNNKEENYKDNKEFVNWKVGKGKVIQGPYKASSLNPLGIEPDIIFKDSSNSLVSGMAWIHRTAADFDIYFVSNQENFSRNIEVSLRVSGRIPELWNPVNGEIKKANEWYFAEGRTKVPLKLEADASIFIIFKEPAKKITEEKNGKNWDQYQTTQLIKHNWKVNFDLQSGGPKYPVIMDELQDWSKHSDSTIRYYSGTAVYSNFFSWNYENENERIWLDLGEVNNIAEVKVNGISCGIAWTPPYQVEITKALHKGENQLTIEVTNTWANRLIGDHALHENEKITWTTAPFRLQGKPLFKAGLMGPVSILK